MKFFFALLGVALAVNSRLSSTDGPLSTGTEYRFRYEGSLISGIPLPTSQSSLTRLRSEVTIQIQDDNTGILFLRKPEMAMDKSVPTQSATAVKQVPMDELQKRELSKEHEQLLELPMRFHYRNGIVSELVFHERDLIWSENIKRAVVNMIQVNLNKASSQDDQWESKAYNTMEKTIEGECEMAYTIVSKGKNTQVTKSVNFDKCERRVEILYNQRFTTECPECDYKMIAPQTVYNYEFEGRELKEVEIRSVHSVSLKQQPLMRTETRAQLSLIEKKDISSAHQLQAPRGEQEEILYNPEWERQMEEFFKLGDEAEKNPFEEFPNVVEHVEKFVKEMTKLSETDEESVHLFSRLVRTLRMCTESQLKRVHDKIEREIDQKTKTIIEHALAVAGTRNTIHHLATHVKEMSSMKVAQLLKSIQETPYPSHKIAEIVRNIAESRKESPVIRQAAWLAYGSIVRGCVVPTLERQQIEEPKGKKEQFISTLERLWEKSETVYDKVLALKTIANAGIPETVKILEQIIKKREEQTIVRMEAIDALRQMSRQIPHRIQKILLPVYSNRLEKNEIRMSALSQFLQAQPALPELSQIVSRMEREPNQHVAAFTFHMLSALAESPLPSHRNISVIASTLMRSTQFRPESRILALYKSLPLFNEEHGIGMNLNFASVLGKESVIPKDMMVSLETITGGSWHKYLAQVGFSHQNVEKLINKVFTKLTKLSAKPERYSSSRASRLSQSISAVKRLSEQLNIRPRVSSDEEPFAMLYIRYKQMDYAVLPLDEELLDKAIERYIQDGSIDMKVVERLFNFDSTFSIAHAGYLIDSIVKMPTVIGIPLSITAKLPTIFVAPGKISTEKIPYGLKLRLEAQPQLALTQVHTMNIWCPIFEHGVKTLRSIKAQLPIDIELEIVTKNDKVEIKHVMRTPEEQKTLLSVHSRPVSYIKFFHGKKDYKMAEESTITAPKVERLALPLNKKIEIQGLEFEVVGQTYRQWTLESLLLGEPSMELTVKPRRSTPTEIIARLVVDKLVEEKMEKPSVEKMLRKDMETEQGEWESRSESSRRQQLEKAIDEMELSRAVKSQIQLTIEGTEKVQVELRTEHEPRLRFVRVIAEVKPEKSREWRLKSEVEVVLPMSVSSVEELKEKKHREVQIFSETKWGSEKIEIVAQLEQTKSQRTLAQQPKQLRGVPAQERLSQLARLNQLKARVDYRLSPRTEQIIQDYFGLLKAYTYWNNEIKMAKNEEGRVLLRVSSEPLLSGLYNMTVETPESELLIQNVRFFDIVPTIVRQPKNFLRHSSIEKAECKIEENRINSFESRVFSFPQQTCYTIVSKDCSEEPRFAVLVRNVQKKSDEKMVKIIYENDEYELEFHKGELKVTLNGEKIRENKFEENKIEMIGDLCVVDLGELVVRFDGNTVKVLLDNSEMDSQCGLCGNSVEPKERKYRNARNEETDDLENFHASFILKKSSDECPIETTQKKQYKEYSYDDSNSDEQDYDWERSERRQIQSRKQSRDESSSEEKNDEGYDSESRDVSPVERTFLQEHSNKVCFSLDAHPMCPNGYEMSKPQEKKIRYGCIVRASSRAREMLAQVRRGEIVNTSDITLSYIDSQFVPKTCVRA